MAKLYLDTTRITGVRLEGPDYVLGIIAAIVGGEFKQVGKIAGMATESLRRKQIKLQNQWLLKLRGPAKGSIKSG
ncbi:hypothetical protein P7H12_16505 [Paenibacillus larvae]|nr:hypothetical protein [Paenibacillus larvae]MDT2264874.1 hypothetical protein [Paenibacillus larvae]